MGRGIQWHNIEGSPIVCTENVFEYRRSIAEYVTADDVAIEVGCAEGLTTALIAQQAHRVFGIDKSSSQVSKAIARHQQQHNLSFHEIEAWDLNSVLKLTAAAGVTLSVVFIDVSGSRRVGDVENLVMKYEQVFNPRLFVVKSYQLKRLINRCQLFFCPSNHNHNQGQRHAAGQAAGEAADPAASVALVGADATDAAQAAASGLCAQQSPGGLSQQPPGGLSQQLEQLEGQLSHAAVLTAGAEQSIASA